MQSIIINIALIVSAILLIWLVCGAINIIIEFQKDGHVAQYRKEELMIMGPLYLFVKILFYVAMGPIKFASRIGSRIGGWLFDRRHTR